MAVLCARAVSAVNIVYAVCVYEYQRWLWLELIMCSATLAFTNPMAIFRECERCRDSVGPV